MNKKPGPNQAKATDLRDRILEEIRTEAASTYAEMQMQQSEDGGRIARDGIARISGLLKALDRMMEGGGK